MATALRVLVSYAYFCTDPEQPEYHNLEYFLTHGVFNSSAVDFVFSVVSGSQYTPQLDAIAAVTPCVTVRHVANLGTDLCAHRHALQEYGFHWYAYFIFLNGGTRGPFLRRDSPQPHQWINLFTAKLVGDVKLVGSMINCELRPHVQSWFLVTDAIGAELALSAWACCPWPSKGQAIIDGEVGLSHAVTLHNFTFASQQRRHAVRFDGQCDVPWNPTRESYSIFEYVFIKYGGDMWRYGGVHGDIVNQVKENA